MRRLGALSVLNNNNLTGSIPSSLGSIKRLSFLSLGNNQLSGSIPAAIGNLGGLQFFDMTNNLLTGDLAQTPSLQNLPIDQGAKLAGNQFACPLPSWASKAVPCV
jgi:Leucine-rich repeat (LRR) protein